MNSFGEPIDISAGTTQAQQVADFPSGLPCVSDASKNQWMEYVYMQQPEPTNVTGVPVTLYVLDSNNNYRSIGTTTTNALGDYSDSRGRPTSQATTPYTQLSQAHIHTMDLRHPQDSTPAQQHPQPLQQLTPLTRLSLKHNPHVRSCRHNHRDSHHRRSNSTGTHQKTAISQRHKK